MSEAEALRRIEEVRKNRSNTLNLAGLGLKTLPPEIWGLQSQHGLNLNGLNLNDNQLQELPPKLFELKSLWWLEINNNQLQKLPTDLNKLQNLFGLYLNDNNLTELPAELSKLQRLSRLYLNHNELTKLPTGLEELRHLWRLELNHNKLQNLPDNFGQSQSLRWLKLNDNKLEEFPPELVQLPSLWWLELNNNKLKQLPDDLAKLQQLEELDISGNELRNLPTTFCQLINLRKLYINHNHLVTLPADFENLQLLEELDISNNQFDEIPSCLRDTNLDILYIQGNRLDIEESSLDSCQLKSYFEIRNSVNESYALAERTSEQINQSSNGDTRDFWVKIIDGAEKLRKRFSETVKELSKNPNFWVSQGLKRLQSCVYDYIFHHVIRIDFVWAYLQRLADGGLDDDRAKEGVNHLKEKYPDATKERICDLLVLNKFTAATGVELGVKLQEELDLIEYKYNFIAVSTFLEELVFQIGYCYGFEKFNWLEDIVVFAIVYNTQRFKELGIDWIESIPSDLSEIPKLYINTFANFVIFQAIGYTAKCYYRFKRQGIDRYKELDKGVEALFKKHISQEAQVEQTLEMTVKATRDVWSYQAERNISESEQKQPRENIQTTTQPEPRTRRSDSADNGPKNASSTASLTTSPEPQPTPPSPTPPPTPQVKHVKYVSGYWRYG